MRDGQIILTHLPQSDSNIKIRPVLLLIIKTITWLQ